MNTTVEFSAICILSMIQGSGVLEVQQDEKLPVGECGCHQYKTVIQDRAIFL